MTAADLLHETIVLRGAYDELARYLLPANEDPSTFSTGAFLAAIETDGLDRCAARLYAYHLAESIEEGRGALRELMDWLEAGIRPRRMVDAMREAGIDPDDVLRDAGLDPKDFPGRP
jgi:hypothetical protein